MKLPPRAYGSLQVLHITYYTLTVDGNGIANINSVDNLPVAEKVEHTRRIKASKTSSEHEKTLQMVDSYTKTNITSPRQNISIWRRDY